MVTVDQHKLFKSCWRHNQIEFDADRHVYIYTDLHTGVKEEWSGVTTLIKRFQPKVGWDSIAFGVARKRRKEGEDISKNEVLAEWKAKGTESAARGTAIHDAIERWIEEGVIDEEYRNVIEDLKFNLDLYGLTAVQAEALIYDEQIKCASMIDILCVSDNKLVVMDTKTMANGIKYKSHGGKKMLAPFHRYEDCDYTKFCIQVGIYQRWLLRKYHVDVDGAYIFHTDGTKSTMVPVMNMQKEIEEMYHILRLEQQETPPWEN